MLSETATYPLDELLEILDDCGFTHREASRPPTPRSRASLTFDPHGPLSKEWRDGDSVWSLVAGDRLDRALSRLRKLDQRGELGSYVARNDALRSHIARQPSFMRPEDSPTRLRTLRSLCTVNIEFTIV